jgi:hypothetical protein
MKWWKQIAFFVAVIVIGVGSFYAYRAITKQRDLRETLLWMDQTYNPHEGGDNFGQGHGWEIHYARKGDTEEVTEKFGQTFTQNGSCDIVIHGVTPAVGIFREVSGETTYKLSLCDIDPNSIKIKTYDLHKDVFNCADPDEVKLYNLSCDNAEVEFRTRNGAPVIKEDSVSTYLKLTGTDHESRKSSTTNELWFIVDDVPYAQRLANALRHAVELCGGTPSKF